jgi:hypothetical protein
VTQNCRYESSIKNGKGKLEPVKWEKLAILNNPKEGGQATKDGGIRSPKYTQDNQIDCKRLLEVFDKQYSNLKWNLFGTLSFDRKDLELWRARRAFDEWMNEMIVDDAWSIFQRLRIIEHNAAGGSCRFHFFVMSSNFTSKYILMARWRNFVSGEADLWYATTSAAVKQYLKKTVLLTSRFELDYHEF